MLHDPLGRRATFRRRQRVRFVEDGVGTLLDHVWADGVVLTRHHHGVGTLAASFRDGDSAI